MIYEIAARNPKGEILNMVLKRPEITGINVINVTGITPIGAEIYITPFGSIDGGLFAGARVPSRNIVLTLGMYNKENEDGTLSSIEDARRRLYNFFRIKDPVNLVFVTDTRISQANGYVESVDVDIFSDHEQATVSVICVDPWFHSESKSSIGFSGVMGEFEFPFESVEGGTNYVDLIEFGRISVDTRTSIEYNGDIETGFNIHMSFLDMDFHNIYLYNMDTRERIDIYTDKVETLTGQPLMLGDEIIISTVSGNKTCYLLRNGIFTNAISIIDKNSDWFKLTKGTNIFAFASDYGVENIVMTISFENTYGGI